MIIMELKSPQKTGEITGGQLSGVEVYNYLFAQVGENEYTPIPCLLNTHETVKVVSNNKIIRIEYNSEDYYVRAKDVVGKTLYVQRVLERKQYGVVKKVVLTGDCAKDFIQFMHLYHVTTGKDVFKKFYPDTWKKYLHAVKIYNPHKHKIKDCVIYDMVGAELIRL